MRRMSLGVLALALCVTPALRAQRQPTEGIRFGLAVGATMPMGIARSKMSSSNASKDARSEGSTGRGATQRAQPSCFT